MKCSRRRFNISYSGNLVHDIDGERGRRPYNASTDAGRYNIAADFPSEIYCPRIQERLGIAKLHKEFPSRDSVTKRSLKRNRLRRFASELSSCSVAFFPCDGPARKELIDCVL